ncbi:MAG: hypothetical protein ABI461_15530 [Polyangiaceae bacterium]
MRACTPCHLQEGESGIDLTTLAAWKLRRAAVRRSVVEDEIMPPDQRSFTDTDRELVRAWIDDNK